MSKKIAIAAAAIISMATMSAFTSGASANSYGYHQSYASHSCYKTSYKVPAWKTVWRWKTVSTGCGYERIKYRATVKVWHTKWKTVCH